MIEKKYSFEIVYLKEGIFKTEKFYGITKADIKNKIIEINKIYKIIRLKWDFLGY